MNQSAEFKHSVYQLNQSVELITGIIIELSGVKHSV